MGAKVGYILLGMGIICTGLVLLFPVGSSAGNSTSMEAGAAQAGLSCFAGLFAYAGLGLTVGGDIVLFVKRNEMTKDKKRGTIAGLAGAISIGVFFIVSFIISIVMIASVFMTLTSQGSDPDIGATMDRLFGWVFILAVFGIFQGAAQVVAEGGPAFFDKKKAVKVLGIVGGTIVIILTIVQVVITQSIIDDVRTEYAETDFENEVEVEELQTSFFTGELYAARAATSIGHFLMAVAVFLMATRYKEPEPKVEEQLPIENMNYQQY